MKKVIIVFLLFIPCVVHPAEKKQNSFELGAAYLKQSNTLSTWSSNKRVDSLFSKPQTNSKVLPLILFDLSVGYGDENAVYLKTPVTELDDIGIALGTRYRPKHSMDIFDCSVFFSPFVAAWKNPYETGTEREDTDINRYGAKLAFESILNTGLSSSLKVAKIDVEDDEIGEIFGTLKRNGNVYTLSAWYNFLPERSFHLNPELSIRRGDFEGTSNAFFSYRASLRALYMTEQWMLMPTLFYALSKYDEPHPFFGKKRDEDSYGAFIMATYSQLFGLQDNYVRIILGYSKRNSTLSFFDTVSKFLGITMGYNF